MAHHAYGLLSTDRNIHYNHLNRNRPTLLHNQLKKPPGQRLDLGTPPQEVRTQRKLHRQNRTRRHPLAERTVPGSLPGDLWCLQRFRTGIRQRPRPLLSRGRETGRRGRRETQKAFRNCHRGREWPRPGRTDSGAPRDQNLNPSSGQRHRHRTNPQRHADVRLIQPHLRRRGSPRGRHGPTALVDWPPGGHLPGAATPPSCTPRSATSLMWRRTWPTMPTPRKKPAGCTASRWAAPSRPDRATG
jgi:hypothetical protein